MLPDALANSPPKNAPMLPERLAGKYGLPVNELPQGGTVSGEYRGTEHLHAGKLAVVVTDESVFVSPSAATPTLARAAKSICSAHRPQDATVEMAAGQTLDLDAGIVA